MVFIPRDDINVNPTDGFDNVTSKWMDGRMYSLELSSYDSNAQRMKKMKTQKVRMMIIDLYILILPAQYRTTTANN